LKTVEFDFEGRTFEVEVGDSFDETNPRDIEKLKQAVWQSESQNESGAFADFVSKAFSGMILEPTGRAFEISEDLRLSGQRAMKDAYSKLKSGQIGSAAFNGAMGMLQYVFSPVSGAAQAFAGEPVQRGVEMGLEAAGVDPNIGVRDIPVVGEQLADFGGDYSAAEFAGGLAAGGAEMIQPSAFISALSRGATPTKEVLRTSATAKKTYDDVINKAGDATQAAEEGSAAFVPRASVPLTRDVVTNPTIIDRVKKIRAESTDNQRLYKDVGAVLYQGIKDNEIPLSSVSTLARDLDMEPVEFVRAWEQSIKEAGQSLNLLSQAAKRMADDPQYPPELRMQIKQIANEIARDKSITNAEKFMNVWRKVENFRRGMMVSQVKTAVRNAASSVGRIGTAMFDDAAQAYLGGGNLRDVYNSIASDFKALPGIRNHPLLNDILEGNPITREKLLNTSTNEVDADLLNRFGRAMNTFNIFQERAFRKYAFQARLEKLARDAGANLEEMEPSKIPDAWLENATKHALDMTFAANGGKLTRDIVSFYDKFPVLYTISNPFPRFQFANSIPFLIEHSPYGLMKAFSPKMAEDLASGNSRTFAKAASRGLIGSLMLGQAMDLRNKIGGEKWYELEIPNEDGSSRVIDVRPYAPMSMYLFMAEVINDARNPDKISTLTARDFAEAAIGMNRVEGTGLILADILRSGDMESVGERIANFVGDWSGAFTTPLAQAKDVAQAITGDNFARDPRGDTAFQNIEGPTLRNIPVLESNLPPRRSPLQQGPITQEDFLGMPGPIASQVTGVNMRQKSVPQREVDRLAIDYSIYNPSTGIKEMDRRQTAIMGEYEPKIANFIMSDMYQSKTDAEKKVLLEEVLKEVRREALDRLKKSMSYDDPELLRRYQIEQGTNKSVEELLKERGLME